MHHQHEPKDLGYIAAFLTVPVFIIVSGVRHWLIPTPGRVVLGVNVTDLVAIGVVATLVSWLIHLIYKFLGRCRPVSWLLGIPNINGRWEGWYYRAASNELCPTAHEISQRTPTILSAIAFGLQAGEQNTSESLAVALCNTSESRRVLLWPYRTKGRVADPGGTHDGTHVMEILDDGYMVGEYYNNPEKVDPSSKGGWGVIVLKRSTRPPMSTLGISTVEEARLRGNWALPEEPPRLVALRNRVGAGENIECHGYRHLDDSL